MRDLKIVTFDQVECYNDYLKLLQIKNFKGLMHLKICDHSKVNANIVFEVVWHLGKTTNDLYFEQKFVILTEINWR